MFREESEIVGKAAQNKYQLLEKNPLGYFIASMLAGLFVGFGVLLIFSIGGFLNGQPYVKVVMGMSFGIALSLVIMAGAELFTGNNFVMTMGLLQKKVSLSQTLKLWLVCFLGNLAGSVLLAILFWQTGLASGAVGEFILTASKAKMELGIFPLFFRGILCNILVCLAIWCSFRCKSESGKLIMIFWCLFAFITTGFEHSVANMTLLFVGVLISPDTQVQLSGYAYNLLFATLGNMVGGILFTALPYYVISLNKKVSD
ncbi:transporter [Anaerocolumna cellulosilytica]|uniref:Transporter n=1 Tax=Anaerocolumna cellulosilytica TaxID=433286 RepID=A0A6S6QWK9_9FIRM|nr:formate/nitrite transporter family protein [Anaerocolumna cellulosilytica]MBB5193779.1 nitrite transporter NirC [Anaerocolumna cellulosilytica]BCJ95004.1 transporter [Anaerocolumna cellulosilytica]